MSFTGIEAMPMAGIRNASNADIRITSGRRKLAAAIRVNGPRLTPRKGEDLDAVLENGIQTKAENITGPTEKKPFRQILNGGSSIRTKPARFEIGGVLGKLAFSETTSHLKSGRNFSFITVTDAGIAAGAMSR